MNRYHLSDKLAPGAMERIEILLAKHCPRLMATGGGAISSEGRTQTSSVRSSLSPEKVAKACALARAGKHCREDIARATGLSVSSIQWILRDNDLKAPDGRPTANARKAKL